MLSIKPRLGSQKGQTVVELGLIFLVFVATFFPILEYSHVFYVRLTLRHSLREAGRYMVTGLADAGNPGTSETYSRGDAIESVFERFRKGTGAHMKEFTLNPANGGGPGELVTITARFDKPLFMKMFSAFFPGIGNCQAGRVCFDMNVTFRNEPFGELPEPPAEEGGGGYGG